MHSAPFATGTITLMYVAHIVGLKKGTFIVAVLHGLIQHLVYFKPHF